MLEYTRWWSSMIEQYPWSSKSIRLWMLCSIMIVSITTLATLLACRIQKTNKTMFTRVLYAQKNSPDSTSVYGHKLLQLAVIISELTNSTGGCFRVFIHPSPRFMLRHRAGLRGCGVCYRYGRRNEDVETNSRNIGWAALRHLGGPSKFSAFL